MTVLAELLNQRKAAFDKIRDLQAQITKLAVVEEPDVSVDGTALVRGLIDDLEATATFTQIVTVRINEANNAAQVEFEGVARSLMDRVALRDRLQLVVKQRESIQSDIEGQLGLGEGRRRSYLYSRERRSKDDIKDVSLIDLVAFKAETKRMADRVRALDIEIQKVNWSYQV